MKTKGLRTLVTGGGSSIGFAVARRLARDNTVVIAGRHQGRLDRAMAQTPGLGAQVLDVAPEEDTRRAIDRVGCQRPSTRRSCCPRRQASFRSRSG
jgi:uncharacterized oxidoreductase